MASSHSVALILLFTAASTPSGVKVSKAPTPPSGWNLRPQAQPAAEQGKRSLPLAAAPSGWKLRPHPPARAAAPPGHWSGTPLGKWGGGASQPGRLVGSPERSWTGKMNTVNHSQQQPPSPAGPPPQQRAEAAGQRALSPGGAYKEYHSQYNSSRGFTVHYEQANFTRSSWYNSTGGRLNHSWCRDHRNSSLCKFARWRTNHTLCHDRYNGSRCNFTYHSHYNHTYRNHHNRTYHNQTYQDNASRSSYPTSPVATENKVQEESATSVAPPWKQYHAQQIVKPTLKVHYDHQSSPNEGLIAASSFRTGAHFQSLAGTKYDVNQPGEYLLLRVPRDENEMPLLEVWGHFLAAADSPCELYTRTVTVSGKGFDEKILHMHSLPFSMKVSQVNAPHKGKWRSVGEYIRGMSHLHEREILPQDAITITPIEDGEDVTSVEMRIGLEHANSTADSLRQEQALIHIAPRAQGLDVVFSSVLSLLNATEQFGGLLGNDRQPSAEVQRGMCEAFVKNATDADLQALREERVGSRLSAS